MKDLIINYLQHHWRLRNHPLAGKEITALSLTKCYNSMRSFTEISFEIEDQRYKTELRFLSAYVNYTMPSLEFATERLHLGIAEGLYGPPYKLRMLQFNPRVCSIEEESFAFGMYYAHCVFHTTLTPEIATHWGIKPLLKKNGL